jgi:hypothetical protein
MSMSRHIDSLSAAGELQYFFTPDSYIFFNSTSLSHIHTDSFYDEFIAKNINKANI